VFWIAEFSGGAFAGLLYNLFIKNAQSDGQAPDSEKFEVVAEIVGTTDGNNLAADTSTDK